jgi:RNA polymerase sigma-70 factor (ECF subfamily)
MDPLIARAVAGDKEAFSALVEREGPRARAYVACRLGDPEAAEDLAQEAFVAAYRKLADFDPQSEFWPWLRGIAHNLVMNERRKLSRRQIALEGLLDRERGGAFLPERPRPSALDLLARCLARLSDKMKDLIHLRYSEGLQMEEIAGRLKMTGGSVRVVHVRVLRTLRNCMATPSGGEASR